MKKIQLPNRDGADLRLEQSIDNIWHLVVDDKHSYCLKYMRVGYTDKTNNIEFVDPSGGPMLEVGDKFKKYEIVKIINPTTFELRERDNN